MAAITIPDNVRPVLAALAKYHFWILAALAPLLLVPMLLMGTGTLRTGIDTQRRQIEGKLAQSRAVNGIQPHPNERWQAAIDADTAAIGRETLAEWERFHAGQADLRVWPAALGEPFLAAVAALGADGKLDRQSLIRYQNMAPRLVATLPARMGVESGMTAASAAAPGALPGSAPAGAPPARRPALMWNPASQQRVAASFAWNRVPNTTQVLLAQEELWVYGLFCDLLARFVKDAGATGAHDSPLTVVDDLVIGFPTVALSDAGKQRIFVDRTAATAGEQPTPMMDVGVAPEAAAVTPWNPRFSGGSGAMAPPGGPPGGFQPGEPPPSGEQAPGSVEDAYRGWVYVDLAGKPLSAEELAAAQTQRMVHLLPFVLRVRIDQRQIDRFLAALAAEPVPIDVREVRVNPGAAGVAGAAGGPAPSQPAGTTDAAGSPRPNDVTMELRGSVALATRPETPPAAAAAGEELP